MPKSKKPNTITMLNAENVPTLYAVNRKARRELLALGARFVAVPMPTLRAYDVAHDSGTLKVSKEGHTGHSKLTNRIYEMVTKEGARLPFTPRYDNSAARKAARGKY